MTTPSDMPPTMALPTETFEAPKPPRRRLTRPRDGRWIAGVCVGIARFFGVTPRFVRLAFVLSCLLPGPQFVIYLMLWLIIPTSERA